MLKAVREGGGVINTAITMAAAAAIVKKQDRIILAENGGHIRITKTWAKSFLQRIGYVKRRGSSTAKMTIKFEAVRDQFLFDIKTIVEMEEIPLGLVFNWDQTGISIVPGSAWTMELKDPVEPHPPRTAFTTRDIFPHTHSRLPTFFYPTFRKVFVSAT